MSSSLGPDMGDSGLAGRQMDRRGFLGVSLGVGLGALGLASGCGGGGSSTSSVASGGKLTAGSDAPGRLVVMEWSGFEVPQLWKPYAREFPGERPKFPVMTNTQDAYAKLVSGAQADLAHPSFADLQQWAQADLLEPFDTSLIEHFDQLNPEFVKRGVIDGKQCAIPSDWGYNSVVYRADLVEPREESWGLLFDDRYAGKIAWRDHPTTMPVAAALYLGFEQPYDMSDDQLAEVKSLLLSKKKLVRTFWATETDLRADMAAGNVAIAPGEGGTYVAMRSRGLDVVFMQPKEGRITWLEGFVLPKSTERPYRAHRYVDAWVAPSSGLWLEKTYSYGSANTAVDLSKLDKQFVETFNLENPNALSEGVPEAYCPRKDLYVQMMNEVKAA